MSTLTYLTEAAVKDGQTELDGKVLTRAALLITDGTAVTYAVDVDIGKDGEDAILRNVPIARGNYELLYADVGAAVRLRRTGSGRYEVVGFSNELPGTLTCIPVNLNDFTFGVIEDLTLTTRSLPYGELAPYGTLPYGAMAIYRGNVLLEVRT